METGPQSRWTHKHCITQCISVEPPFSSLRSSPLPLITIPCVCPAMEHRDSGLKMSLSTGIKFSSPSRCHLVSSLLLSSPSCQHPVSSLLISLLLSPSHVRVLQWRDSRLKVLVYWYSIKLLTHLLLNSMLPLNVRDTSDTCCCHGDDPSV